MSHSLPARSGLSLEAYNTLRKEFAQIIKSLAPTSPGNLGPDAAGNAAAYNDWIAGLLDADLGVRFWGPGKSEWDLDIDRDEIIDFLKALCASLKTHHGRRTRRGYQRRLDSQGAAAAAAAAKGSDVNNDAAKGATKQAAKETTKQAAKETTKQAAKEATKQAAKEATKKAAEGAHRLTAETLKLLAEQQAIEDKAQLESWGCKRLFTREMEEDARSWYTDREEVGVSFTDPEGDDANTCVDDACN